MVDKFQDSSFDFANYLSSYLKRPWKFYAFEQLLELECLLLKLRDYIYLHSQGVKENIFLSDSQKTTFHENNLIFYLRSLRSILEQSCFLDLKINIDFLLNPPKKIKKENKYEFFSFISPLLYSDNLKLSYEILLTLICLNNLSENLKTLNSKDRILLSLILTGHLLSNDLSTKTPLLSLLQGERTEEDREKLVKLCEKIGLELEDLNDKNDVSTYILLKSRGAFPQKSEDLSLEDINTLLLLRNMRFFANSSYRLFICLDLILIAELLFNGIKTIGEGLETYIHKLKEEKRSLIVHVFEQMTHYNFYNTSESPDYSVYIYETLQLSGFSYEHLLIKAKVIKDYEVLEGVLVKKWRDLWNENQFKKSPYIENQSNLIWFLKLADKIRFSYENLEAQMKGVDSRGLLSFAEEEKSLLDQTIETIAIEVLSKRKYLENIELLVPIVIYFKTIYNQEENALFSLLYEILQDLISTSLENPVFFQEIQKKYGSNLIEESILQLLQLFFVFEIRNENTEKLNKALLSPTFFKKLWEFIEKNPGKGIDTGHFLFNQILFHSLTNDNNIIRDFLLDTLETKGLFEIFCKIFETFFKENKVIFLCNFNLLRRKVLKICEKSDNCFEKLIKNPENLSISKLYTYIFTACFLLWADTSSLDNDFMEIKCIKTLFEESFIGLMTNLRDLAQKDNDGFLELLNKQANNNENKEYFMIFCDSLAKKYKLIQENLLYFMKIFTIKLHENEINLKIYNEFLQTIMTISNPLATNLVKEYHTTRFHTVFENFSINTQILDLTLQNLKEILSKIQNFSLENGLFLCTKPKSLYKQAMKSPNWENYTLQKQLEVALSLNLGLLRNMDSACPLNSEIMHKLHEICDLLLICLPSVKSGFYSRLAKTFQCEMDETLVIEHYCSLHPQNDFSRKILHKHALLRQMMKFLNEILRLHSNKEIKKLQDLIIQRLLRGNLEALQEIKLENQGKYKKEVFFIKSITCFDEIRRFHIMLHESKSPGLFISESFLRKIAEIFKVLTEINTILDVKNENKNNEIMAKLNIYLFFKLILNFWLDFLLKTLLFNDFSLLLEHDFLLYLRVIVEEILEGFFVYWKGFFKTNEEIPLKLIKIVETLSLKVYDSRNKTKKKSRISYLNHYMLQLFLHSTYHLGLRIRSIYFYKLVHFITLTTESPCFQQIKGPYIAYFTRLLNEHFRCISLKSPVFHSKVLKTIHERYSNYSIPCLNIKVFEGINALKPIESACIQAMLTNLIARLLFSSENWDSEPALEPGLKEMYWNWLSTKDFAGYVCELLKKITEEKMVLTEDELDTLHNDTIGNLVEMLKENIPTTPLKNQVDINEFLDICLDFFEKYLSQQKIQSFSDEKLLFQPLNMIRHDVIRDLMGLMCSGLDFLYRSGKKIKEMKGKILDAIKHGFMHIRVFKEQGLQEKFSQEMFLLLEKMIILDNEEIRTASIEFVIKNGFYNSSTLDFKEKITCREFNKENIEKCFNNNSRYFVNSLYKLCNFSNENENHYTKNSNEEVFLTLRKGIIPYEIQTLESEESIFKTKKGIFAKELLENLFRNAVDNLIEPSFIKDQRIYRLLDLDFTIKLLVLLLGKYPLMMSIALDFAVFLPKDMSFSYWQQERMKRLGFFEKETLVRNMNFIEFCLVFFDEQPFVLRQFLIFYISQDFSYVNIGDNNHISSTFIMRNWFLEILNNELEGFFAKCNKNKDERFLENLQDCVHLKNLLGFYSKILIVYNKKNEEISVVKQKFEKFLKILLNFLRKINSPLDMIVLRELNFFSYLAFCYKSIIKISFVIKTGLPYTKANEYLKYYHNKQLRNYLSKPASEWKKNGKDEHPTDKKKYDEEVLYANLCQQDRKGINSKAEWLQQKEKEIYEYSQNICMFPNSSSQYSKLFLENKEDLRHLATNSLDINIYDSLRNLLKTGIVIEKLFFSSFSKEHYDANSTKYINWPTGSTYWLEKLQENCEKHTSTKVFLSLDQMLQELRALSMDIKKALKSEALRYAKDNQETSKNLLNDLQTQSCLTVFGNDDVLWTADYYEQREGHLEKKCYSLMDLADTEGFSQFGNSELDKREAEYDDEEFEKERENEEEENGSSSGVEEDKFAEGDKYNGFKKDKELSLKTESRGTSLDQAEVYSAKGPYYNSAFVSQTSCDEEESKEMPLETTNTPTFMEKFSLDPGFLNGFSEADMLENVQESVNKEFFQDKEKEAVKKFKLLLMRETHAVKAAICKFKGQRSLSFAGLDSFEDIEKLMGTLPFSIKKKVLLQADNSFLECLPRRLKKEAEEMKLEIENLHEFNDVESDMSSSKDEETWDEVASSDDEEEEKREINHKGNSSNHNNYHSANSECLSLKCIDFVNNNHNNSKERCSIIAENSQISEEKIMEKASSVIIDEFKKPQNSLMKKLWPMEKSKIKTKKKNNHKKSSCKERYLFKNYKKIKEIDEKIDDLDFFLSLPEIDDEILKKLFELMNFSLILSENSNLNTVPLRSVFKFVKTAIMNPKNAFKIVDGLIFMMSHYSQPNSFESTYFPNYGYGLVDQFPLIKKKELRYSGMLNNLFSIINKLVEKHYCLPLFLQGIIEKDRSLSFSEISRQQDYSIEFIKILRNQDKISKIKENIQNVFIKKDDEKCSKINTNVVNGNETHTLVTMLISSLNLYEKNNFSYLNGEILLSLIKNLLKLTVVNDGFQKKVKYPKYKNEISFYNSNDVVSLCQIFYQKRIRLKYFESPYYELFVEYSKSPINFERFFIHLIANYTQIFTEAFVQIREKIKDFKEKCNSEENWKKENKLKFFWEKVLLNGSYHTLAEDFHIFRHIVKDLAIVSETPLKVLYEGTIYKDFHKKFGFSVKDIETESSESEKVYLVEWLSLQKSHKKALFINHLKEKILKNENIISYFDNLIQILKEMVEIFGVDFQESAGSFEKERLEDCYYFFIYPIKSFLILYSFLSCSEEDSIITNTDYIAISGIKTKEILKSENDFNSHSDDKSYDLYSQKLSNTSDCISPMVKIKLPEKLDFLYNGILGEDFLKLITFFMQSKGETDKLVNYLDYIRRAKRKGVLTLDIKLGYLRSYSRQKACMHKNNSRFLDDPLNLILNRQNLWNSTLETLIMVPSDELALRPLKIVFEGEEGIDYGGITREWLSLLNKEIFDPNYGLFKLSANRVSYQPNPLSCIIPDHLTQFREIGRLIGKILLDNLNIEINFVQSFLKHILGQTLYIRDLSSIDPDLCKNLEWILENDVSDLDLNFSYDFDLFDMPITVDLIEDGQNIKVSEANKKEYVKQMCYAKMASEIKPQTEAFLTGFLSIIPREALNLIDDKELGMKLCGTSEIDVDDMKNYTEYLSYSPENNVIKWLWELLKEFDQETLAKFLFFVTGSFKVPFGGFKNFRIKIERLFDGNALPTAHTCFNQLDLPDYETKEKMREKLLVAILEGNKGFYIC